MTCSFLVATASRIGLKDTDLKDDDKKFRIMTLPSPYYYSRESIEIMVIKNREL